MEDFIKLIHNDKSIIETRLNKVYADNNEFEKMCAYSFSVGGKRIRAILLLEAFKICRDISDIAIDFSVALELIHNYSLVHDDLPEMDDDKFRRGVLSVYGKYGQSNAVLVGDELLNNANLIMFKAIKQLENIDEIKKTCRWCVIVCHGGEEFTSLPSSYTRDRYHKFLEMGADIVVAHHPHVPMNYETVNDKVIFYSLGNFIFDTEYQRAQYNTEHGILVKINFTEKKFTWDACGICINRDLEHVRTAKLPDIFTDVQEEEYKKLEALAAKMMVSAYKRQLIYLNPKEYQNVSEEKWKENFLNPKRSGRVEGEALDFQIIYPLAKTADDGEWEKSKLKKVIKYIQKQI